MYAHTFRLYLLGTGLVVGLYFYRTSYKQTLITTDCVLVCCNGGNCVAKVVFLCRLHLSGPMILLLCLPKDIYAASLALGSYS